MWKALIQERAHRVAELHRRLGITAESQGGLVVVGVNEAQGLIRKNGL
jgi:hypothetical protein